VVDVVSDRSERMGFVFSSGGNTPVSFEIPFRQPLGQSHSFPQLVRLPVAALQMWLFAINPPPRRCSREGDFLLTPIFCLNVYSSIFVGLDSLGSGLPTWWFAIFPHLRDFYSPLLWSLYLSGLNL